MLHSNKYYVVSEDLYDQHFSSPAELEAKLLELPKSAETKCRKLLSFLDKHNISYNAFGVVNEIIPEMQKHFEIFDFIHFSAVGTKRPPVQIDNFLNFLKRINTPTELLCAKAKRKLKVVKKEKRKKLY